MTQHSPHSTESRQAPPQKEPAALTPYEKKQIEGQRIMPLMGAMGALPAAGIVTLGAFGAPMFALAIGLIAASYAFWVFTDGIYYGATFRNRLPGPLFLRMIRAGTRYQRAMFGYGALSICLTLSGFVAEHSTIRGPLSVNAGFAIAATGFALVTAPTVWAFLESNNLTTTVRHALSGPDQAPEQAGDTWTQIDPLAGEERGEDAA